MTNDEFRHFDKARRIPVDLGKLGFAIMDSLFKQGDDYLAELEEARSKLKRLAENRAAKSLEKTDSRNYKKLREADPW